MVSLKGGEKYWRSPVKGGEKYWRSPIEGGEKYWRSPIKGGEENRRCERSHFEAPRVNLHATIPSIKS